MEKIADQIEIDVASTPNYDPKLILEKAGIDWSDIDSLNADTIAVSQDLADAWNANMGDEQFKSIGPKVDPNLPEGTVAIFKDLMGEGTPNSDEQNPEGPQDEVAQGTYRVGEENAGDGEAKDMLPGASGRRSNTYKHPGQRALARYSRSAAKHGPRDYHSAEAKGNNPKDYHEKPTREYDLTGWWDFEAEVSGSGSGPFLGKSKGTDKKEKKT